MGFYSVAAGTPAICFLGANTSEMRLEVISSIVDFSALKKKERFRSRSGNVISARLVCLCQEPFKKVSLAFIHPAVFSPGPRQHHVCEGQAFSLCSQALKTDVCRFYRLGFLLNQI